MVRPSVRPSVPLSLYIYISCCRCVCLSVCLYVCLCVGDRQEYAGEPINCWTPSTFPQEHYTQHVNGYCWTHPLRYPTSSDEAGVSGVEAEELLKKRRVVNFGTAFYRWVTLIFVMQVSLLAGPCVN